MTATGRLTARNVTPGTRVLVERESAEWAAMMERDPMLVPARRLTGVQTVLVTEVTSELTEAVAGERRRSRYYTLHTAAGPVVLAAHQTVIVAPETPAAIKRAHVEALAADAEITAAAEAARVEARAIELDAAAVVAGYDDVVTAVAEDTTAYGDAVRAAAAEITEDDRFDLTDAGHAVLAEADPLAAWKALPANRTTDADGTEWVSHPAPAAGIVPEGYAWIPGLPVLVQTDTDPAPVAPQDAPAAPVILDALPLTGPAWSMLAAPGLPSDLTPRDADVTPSGRLRSWVDALAWAVQRRLPVDLRNRQDIPDAKLDDYIVDRVAAYVADRGGYGLDDRLAALRQINDAADAEAAEWVRMIEEAGNRAN